jgi:hypothetical protein
MSDATPLAPGARLYTGARVSPQLADAYNAATAKIEAFRATGKPVPENLLNGRHNLLESFAHNLKSESI